MLPSDLSSLTKECTAITDKADTEIRSIYAKHHVACTRKEDCSPLTEADIASHHIILDALHSLTPDIPVISEEGADPIHLQSRFWLVDPLDGTKEFINRNGEFTVNISLIENKIPVLGIVSAPALHLTYTGAKGITAKKRNEQNIWSDIAVAPHQDKVPVKIVGSKSHGNEEVIEWVNRHYPHAEFCGIGSSLKFCLIAEGKATLYPRFGRTMEWDTAAGHAVLTAAGGSVVTLENKPLTYAKNTFENPHFIASHNPTRSLPP